MFVILNVQNDRDAALGVDFVSSDLSAVGNRIAVYGSAAGQGADHADFNGFFSHGAGKAHGHGQNQQHSNQFLHKWFPP